MIDLEYSGRALAGLKIGFALTGSHCTLARALATMRYLRDLGADITPIFSPTVARDDTRFGTAAAWHREVLAISGKKEVIADIVAAEPIGPQALLDVLLIAPCTGNTLAKMANGITDTAVVMAAKAHLRNQRPVVLAIATNDGLSANAKNIGLLLNSKNIYFVPYGQDDALGKANSLIADFAQVAPTIEAALKGSQYQPALLV